MLRDKLEKIVKILTSYQALKAIVSWPHFSISSFEMLSSLSKQGLNPNTILDVGANVGQFAVASAKLFPSASVYSFEPLPDCYERLSKNVASLNNVKLNFTALGEEIGEVQFNVNEHAHSSSILSLSDSHLKAFPHARHVEKLMVPVSTLDTVFGDIKFNAPSLLKLDVQGYESQVLCGGRQTLKRIDYVILESSFKPMYEGEKVFLSILDLMKSFDFEFVRPVGWLSNPETGEILQMDALFSRNKNN